MTRRDREPDFLSALAWLDVYYDTESSADLPEWDDEHERRAHVAHARAMGWKPPQPDEAPASKGGAR